MKMKDINYLIRDIHKVKDELIELEKRLPRDCAELWGYIYDYIDIAISDLEEKL